MTLSIEALYDKAMGLSLIDAAGKAA